MSEESNVPTVTPDNIKHRLVSLGFEFWSNETDEADIWVQYVNTPNGKYEVSVDVDEEGMCVMRSTDDPWGTPWTVTDDPKKLSTSFKSLMRELYSPVLENL